MKTLLRAALACVCFTVLLPPVFGQQGRPAPKQGIRGVLDPNTGVFTATPQVVLDEDAAVAAAAITPTSGKYVVNFTIKLVTPVPSGGSVVCSVSASLLDSNPTTFQVANEIFESASSKATVSGGTATCHVSIPYSWYLVNAKSDTVALSYELFMASTTATALNSTRNSSQYVVPGGVLKVPANGATTTYSVSATI